MDAARQMVKTWDLEPLLDGRGIEAIDEFLEEAELIADAISSYDGCVSALEPNELAELMRLVAALYELTARVGSFAELRFCADANTDANGALLQEVEKRLLELGSAVTIDLEWAAVPRERVALLLADPRLAFCRQYLQAMHDQRLHLLTEAEELALDGKSITGEQAWSRLLDELVSDLRVVMDGAEHTLDEAFAVLSDPDRDTRRRAAEAVTASLAPGLRTRAYIFNTLVLDKAIDDRLRGFEHWLARRNLENQLSDASVDALMRAVCGRYDIAHRWYAMKAQMLGLARLADYDRWAPVVDEDVDIAWDDAVGLVLDAYEACSPRLGRLARRFFDDGWIDAHPRAGKHGGAFCAYTVPAVHPYVLCNYTGRRHDVLTLAHELGHGLHALLAADQGMLHHAAPPVLSETASVFGESLLLDSLLESCSSPEARVALLAERADTTIVNLFRYTALHRFEESVHGARRAEGELSPDRLGELWLRSQAEMVGDAVELTEGFTSWWSFIPQLMSDPGTMYAYVHAQLVALSMYERYSADGHAFVPAYLEMLAAGGSRSTHDLAQIAGCSLSEPGFWAGGLDLVSRQVDAAEDAARDAGLLPPVHAIHP
jgi:oligoendopeptidase F